MSRGSSPSATLGHSSLDAHADGEPCRLDQLAAPEDEPANSESVNGLALEQLLDQRPAAQATALRLTVHEGLSLASLGLGIQTHKNLTAALIP